MYSTGKTSGSSLHICRNLSGRAEECSGPWKQQQESNEKGKWWKDESPEVDLGWKDLTMPSMPWGSSSTMPFCRTHLAWPGEMNWSMMHWAVLWKSPNWASQSTRAFGLAMAKPSSKPAHNETDLRTCLFSGHTMVHTAAYSGFIWPTATNHSSSDLYSPRTPYSDRELLHTV